ncbi:MAG: T9SS type A sorting domain-containing protein [Ignavibacteria bacterium]|nr:T9SS type A sorting domain-containing protein [Ignavibacteria bacterium]
MKKTTLYLLLSLLSTSNILSQWINPSPYGMVKTSAGFYVNPSKTYIAGDNGNIYYTPNYGQNWNLNINTKTDNLKNIFMLSASKGFASGDNGKILRTTDGFSWSEIFTAVNSHLYGLYFTDENTGYSGGGNGGLYKTTNSGNNWLSISYSDRSIYSIQFINSNTGFIAEFGRITKTTNAGLNWNVISDTSVHSPQKIFFLNENTGYAAGIGELCKTTNGGVSWVRKYTFSDICTGLYFIDSQTAFLTAGYGAAKTTNGGDTWTFTTFSGSHGITGVVFMNATTGVVFESSGKIFRTTDAGATWKTTSNYFTDADITDAKYYGTKKGWACAHGNFLYKTTNSGINWDTVSLGSNAIENIAIADSMNLWGFNNSLTIGRSTNGGANWSFQTYPFANSISSGKFLNKSTGWICGGYGNIYLTTNGGNNWTDASIGSDASIRKVQFINAQTGWACKDGGFYRLYKTTNGGVNWTGSFINADGYGKAVQFIDANTGYFLADSYIAKTTDGGNIWVSNPLGFSGARDLFFYGSNFGYCLVGSNKLYRTIDGGSNWGLEFERSNIYNINSMYFGGQMKIWFGGTYGSIISHTISPVDLIRQTSALANNYSLSQNYPNPFNPSTKINYELKNTNYVSLKVFDLLGKEVASLVNEKQNAGSYAVDFNSAEYNLPSGIYFYTFTAGDFKETRKMVLIK